MSEEKAQIGYNASVEIIAESVYRDIFCQSGPRSPDELRVDLAEAIGKHLKFLFKTVEITPQMLDSRDGDLFATIYEVGGEALAEHFKANLEHFAQIYAEVSEVSETHPITLSAILVVHPRQEQAAPLKF